MFARGWRSGVARTALARRVPCCVPARRLSTHKEQRPFLITTPIFYVNAAPHIGHLFTTVLADARARWARLCGHRVVFATGTDEHGLKVQNAAAAQGVSPQQFCDETSGKFRRLFDAAGISYDDFVRTSEPRHRAMATRVWQELQARGLIAMGRHEGWYCEGDEAFLTSQQVRPATEEEIQALPARDQPEGGEPVMLSVESGRVVERVAEENYVFRLSAFQDAVSAWLRESPGAVVPETRRREVLSTVEGGLRDLSVSRLTEKVQWGIPVPGDSSHTMYVWLDALVNYLTVTGASVDALLDAADGNSSDRNAQLWPAAVHVVGKDILKFHAVYWPAFLMGLGLAPPCQVLAHGHWVVDNVKMSKSLGNVVDPFDMMDRHGRDECRYYLLREGGVQVCSLHVCGCGWL